MCKGCGYTVHSTRTTRGQLGTYPHSLFLVIPTNSDNSQFIRTIHIFSTHTFTMLFSYFSSVKKRLYTLYTPLIITKTIYKGVILL